MNPASIHLESISISRRSLLILLATAALLAGCAGGGSNRAEQSALEQLLQQRVRLFHQPTVDVDDIQPLARRFYRQRRFRPVWTEQRGPTADARELVHAVEAAPLEGLDPAT